MRYYTYLFALVPLDKQFADTKVRLVMSKYIVSDNRLSGMFLLVDEKFLHDGKAAPLQKKKKKKMRKMIILHLFNSM